MSYDGWFLHVGCVFFSLRRANISTRKTNAIWASWRVWSLFSKFSQLLFFSHHLPPNPRNFARNDHFFLVWFSEPRRFGFCHKKTIDTFDGRNPAFTSWGWQFISLFTGFYTYIPPGAASLPINSSSGIAPPVARITIPVAPTVSSIWA